MPQDLPLLWQELLSHFGEEMRWRVQKAWVLDQRAELELFGTAGDAQGAKRFLLLDPLAMMATLNEARQLKGGEPPSAQKTLREALCPAQLQAVDLDAERAVLRMRLVDKKARPRALHLELDKSCKRLVLTGVGQAKGSKKNQAPGAERVLLTLGAKSEKGERDLRRGRPYLPPAQGTLPIPLGAAPLAQESAAPNQSANSAERELSARLRALSKRQKRLERKLRADLEKHGDPELLAQEGELLKSVLHQVERGMARIVVNTPAGQEQTLSLDPTLDAKGNLAARFKRAKRAKAAQAHARPRLDALYQEMAELAEIRAQIAASVETGAERGRALLERSQTGTARRHAATSGRRRPWRTFLLDDGVKVFVGRSAKDNDALTFHHARGNDLWAHARDVPGSHVVARLSGREPTSELLLDVAHLAAHFSPARSWERVDVQYTRRKNVRKGGRGAPAGFVHLGEEKVIHLRVDPARIARLLEREVPS